MTKPYQNAPVDCIKLRLCSKKEWQLYNTHFFKVKAFKPVEIT
jgi:hypothetical protein